MPLAICMPIFIKKSNRTPIGEGMYQTSLVWVWDISKLLSKEI